MNPPCHGSVWQTLGISRTSIRVISWTHPSNFSDRRFGRFTAHASTNVIIKLLHCVTFIIIYHLAVEERGGQLTGWVFILNLIMSGKFLGRIFGRFFHPRYFSDFDIYDINVHVICRTSQVVGNFLVQSLHRINVIIEPFWDIYLIMLTADISSPFYYPGWILSS